MLDFVYYPVSAVLWFWHRVFGAVWGPDSGPAWAVAVIFLVFTVRAVLLWPAIRQARTARRMQRLQPRIEALRKKYPGDRQRQALELRQLQQANGVGLLSGCLPALIQAPVFLGLYHVLKSFNRTGTGFGNLGLTPEQNAHTANYVFSATDVQSFLQARLFGVPISVAITTPERMLASFAAYGPVPTVAAIAAVAVPLMLLAGILTHVNARAALARQTSAPTEQAALMNTLMLWVFPFGVLVGGPLLMIAILLYWVGNNLWTFGQQHVIAAWLDRTDDGAPVADPPPTATAPKPGARPAGAKTAGRRRRR